MRKIVDIELETLTQQRLTVALLGKHQAPALDAVYQMTISDDKRMHAAGMRMTDHKCSARSFAAILQHGIDPDGVEQQFFGN